MTAVVSDTSPINYLVLIGAAELLPRLFSEVLIPPAVAAELSRANTPVAVREWIAAPPSWLQIKGPSASHPSLNLDEGETQAIWLAKELGVLSLLIDERKGFHVAESMGLEPIGLLGILELCASRGWISFDEQMSRLRATTFRFNERLIADARARLSSGSSCGAEEKRLWSITRAARRSCTVPTVRGCSAAVALPAARAVGGCGD
jgi:predicted nucleic acid-binding protein